MKKVLGILGLLIFVVIFTSISNPRFLGGDNLFNTLRWTALFSIISLGVAFVIITGGIDLSIGSVVGLVGTTLGVLLAKQGWSVPAALALVTVISLAIGLFHGLLITKMNLQPFVVTLCGLLMYRGIARWMSDDKTVGFGDNFEGLRYLAIGRPSFLGLEIPMPLIIMT